MYTFVFVCLLISLCVCVFVFVWESSKYTLNSDHVIIHVMICSHK